MNKNMASGKKDVMPLCQQKHRNYGNLFFRPSVCLPPPPFYLVGIFENFWVDVPTQGRTSLALYGDFVASMYFNNLRECRYTIHV